MFIDFHVHANLPRWKKQAWMSKWWTQIHRHELDAFVSTEHAYKNAERAYRAFCDSQPTHSKVQIFPGVEVLTKEGIDVLAFAESDKIYGHSELTVPRAVTMDELLDFLRKQKNIVGVIAHPFTPGTTSIVAHKGEQFAKQAIDLLGSVEVHNGAMCGVRKVLENTGLKYLARNKYERAMKTWKLPQEFFPEKPKLLAAGSDAHHPDELGAGVHVDKTSSSKKQAFNIMRTARGRIEYQRNCAPMRGSWTTFKEWVMKKWI